MITKPIEILLVEDNMDDAALTIRALKKINLTDSVFHVKDGEEALDFIFARGKYADAVFQRKLKLILLDLKMPKVNGIEVLKKLKLDENKKSIPVIVLTSSNEDPDILTCYELGVNSYVVKPVNFDSFIATVSDLASYWTMLNRTL